MVRELLNNEGGPNFALGPSAATAYKVDSFDGFRCECLEIDIVLFGELLRLKEGHVTVCL